MFSTNSIREGFLNYFGHNNHKILPASSLIPHNDPTLMFVNSGMVQFKNYFTGTETPNFTRAATSQKSVRAGGKHNDLDNVGYTARHHTFFEMLGNFSFGDYFKEEAILYAWEFLSKELKLPKEKLYFTVYHEDEEAYKLWQKIAGASDDRIIKIATSDNFWSMGDTGPCGPCSEIFYDHGDNIFGGLPGTKDENGDRYIEIWNLVFMQFEQLKDGSRNKLPKPSIDTGMGLERIAAVMQNVHNNYDIDLFKNIIDNCEDILAAKITDNNIASYRVIADHLRSSSFLIADGILPSNEGRGYVLRRIMRRAMRHAYQLGANQSIMHKLVRSLVDEMGQAYPELTRAEPLISETLKMEEDRFRETLGRGLKLLEAETSNITKGGILNGEVAFKLYDTYGFPLDLTIDILRSQSIDVDQGSFDLSMNKQKEMARAAWVGSGENKTDTLWFELYQQFGATEFIGYDTISGQGTIQAIIKDGKIIDEYNNNEEILIICNQTPFYAESGGQIGDIGVIKTDSCELIVTDTQKYVGHLYVHKATITKGHIKTGTIATLTINGDRRNNIRANHSATHLLHFVLRKYLGDHVTQKGSHVSAERLRFDFSYPKAITSNEIILIENEVNKMIWKNNAVTTNLMNCEDAIKAGAMALFGEKYAEEVRVVSMGEEHQDLLSVELCGGTHVKYTGDIGIFKITSESSIASGVRRIEAITTSAALQYMQDNEKLLKDIGLLLKAQNSEYLARISAIADENRNLAKSLANLNSKILTDDLSEKQSIGNFNLIIKILDHADAKEIKNICEILAAKIKGIAVIFNKSADKLGVSIAVSNELTTIIDASILVKTITPVIGGAGGGGRANYAQGGGSDTSKISDAIAKLKEILNQQ
jgi:alanyl-tRNA synthetase